MVSDNGERVYHVENIGNQAALHVQAEEEATAADIRCDDNFFTLFPGECKNVTVHVCPECVYGFDENANQAPDRKAEIVFSHLFSK